MTVGDFVEQWHGDSIQEHSTAPSHAARSKMLLYLKDWHFVKVRVRNSPSINGVSGSSGGGCVILQLNLGIYSWAISCFLHPCLSASSVCLGRVSFQSLSLAHITLSS